MEWKSQVANVKFCHFWTNQKTAYLLLFCFCYYFVVINNIHSHLLNPLEVILDELLVSDRYPPVEN